METVARDISVAVREGAVFRCRPDWNVDKAEAKIRGRFELSGGGIEGIEDQKGALEGTDEIGNAVGDLTFVGGRDLPSSLTAPATVITLPAGKAPMSGLLIVSFLRMCLYGSALTHCVSSLGILLIVNTNIHFRRCFRRARVISWKTCTHHFVHVPPSLQSFRSAVLKKFEDEISSMACSLFLVIDNEAVTERTRITEENYASVMKMYLSSTNDDLKTYFYNELTSPQGSPNSQIGLYCKERDNFQCCRKLID
jgi:hypothetical protein